MKEGRQVPAEGEEREGLRETEQFKQPYSSHCRSFLGCHIFWEPLFTYPLQKERRNLLSAIILARHGPYHLVEPGFQII